MSNFKKFIELHIELYYNQKIISYDIIKKYIDNNVYVDSIIKKDNFDILENKLKTLILSFDNTMKNSVELYIEKHIFNNLKIMSDETFLHNLLYNKIELEVGPMGELLFFNKES